MHYSSAQPSDTQHLPDIAADGPTNSDLVDSAPARTWLFLHGFAGSSRQWRRLAEFVPPGDTVIAPDLPGHGSNPDLLSEPWAELSNNLLGSFGAKSTKTIYIVIGHSLGGLVAAVLAVQHPHLFDHVVLISTAAKLQLHPRLRHELMTGRLTRATVLGGLADRGARSNVADAHAELGADSPEGLLWRDAHLRRRRRVGRHQCVSRRVLQQSVVPDAAGNHVRGPHRLTATYAGTRIGDSLELRRAIGVRGALSPPGTS